MKISKAHARRMWLRAQRLDEKTPFGKGVSATEAAVEHLGYVQIDTIHVIERCHHHILFTRIPAYTRKDLFAAQSKNKSVFEYWTHALSYIPTKDFPFFVNEMKRMQKTPSRWFQSVTKSDYSKVLRMIKKDGALSIRDIEDDVLVEKTHAWASKKPSKRALQLGFYSGKLTISERVGMLKKYELTERHFGWDRFPKAASEKQCTEYLLNRSLRAQGLVTLDSICHLYPSRKPAVKKVIDEKVKKGLLLPVEVAGLEKIFFWATPEALQEDLQPRDEMTHILSPFDPLVIQRKRLSALFDYDHRFEAYLPKEKRVFGYFALPVLIDDRIVAVMDLKADREEQELLIQKWTWLKKEKTASAKRKVEEELHRFEKFQFGI
ncbi:winged helix-turn-helix domain-containing protein [Bdellovibrio bacteriovorus]|uniref:winged helix-turn-helix domain-containing protein n=1 Tax=Bdellovibrio bacteriovorus TaxID=959 RepID=UPI0035A6FA9C